MEISETRFERHNKRGNVLKWKPFFSEFGFTKIYAVDTVTLALKKFFQLAYILKVTVANLCILFICLSSAIDEHFEERLVRE